MQALQNIVRLIRLFFSGSLRYILSSISWELIQTTVGIPVALFYVVRYSNASIGMVHNMIVIAAFSQRRPLWGGICFGRIMIGDSRTKTEPPSDLVVHEFGHCIQSRLSGPLFLFKYGIPSLLDLAIRGTGHNADWSEQDANNRSREYFLSRDENFQWPNGSFRIYTAETFPPRWWEYFPGFFPLFTTVINYFRGRIKTSE